MERVCKYTILRYVPDDTRQEFINIGVVLHSPQDKLIDCLITSNFTRVSAFDDEADIQFLKIVLDGVKDDFSKTNMISGPSYEDISDPNYLDKATSIYVNQLQFSPIKYIRTKDFDTDLQNLFKVYVYFDVQKKSRITDQDVKSIMNRVIRSKTTQIFEKLNRNVTIDIGTELIALDYAYTAKNNRVKVIKTFSFDYTSRGSKHAPLLAKEWAYNFHKLKSKSKIEETFQTNLKNIDLLTLIYVGNLTKNVIIALDILKEEANTFEVHDNKGIENFADKIAEEIHVG